MSTTDNPVQSVLRTAIQREIDAYNLYTAAADKVEIAHVQDLLKELAAQEVGHRNRLEALLGGRTFAILSKTQQKQVADLKITDYLVEVPLAADSDIQEILIVAGKRETASYNLYSALAKVTDDAETVKLFEFLANEELSHKNRVETMYEDYILQEN